MKTPLFLATTAPNNTGTRYYPVVGGDASTVATWNASTTIYNVPWPVTGTFKGIRLYCPTAVAAGTWTLTLQIGGVDTSLTCSVTGGGTIGTADVDVAVSAGDLVQLEMDAISTPTAQAGVRIALLFEATVASRVPIAALHTAVNTTATFYMPLRASCGVAATQAQAEVIMPCDGTFEVMYARLTAAPATTATVTYTLYVNGAGTGLTTTFASGESGNKSVSASVAVSAGDVVSVERTTNGTAPANALGSIGLEFRPSVDGEAPQFNTQPGAPSNGATRYVIANGNAVAQTTEPPAQQISPGAFKARKLWAQVTNAPTGATKSWAITARKGAASQALTTSIVDTATENSDTSNDFDVADQDLIDFMIVPANTPNAAGQMKIGWVSFIAPASAGGGLLLTGVG